MSTSSSTNDGSGRSTQTGWSDRIFGIVCLVFALWYIAQARTFDGTAFESGPIGPKTLPTGVGVIFAVLALYPIFKPDPSPRWANGKAALQVFTVLLASYIYGHLLEPLGFIVTSALMTVVIGVLFRAPIKPLIPAALILPTCFAYVFNHWLQLALPSGLWGGF